MSDLTDISLPQVDPSKAALATQEVCVSSNTLSKSYTVTASGSGPGDHFALSSGSRTIPFKVHWHASAAQAGRGLSSGIPSGALTSAAMDQACTARNKARLTVEFAQPDLEMAEPGLTYTGILNLTVSPQ
jgi:hypothetical protein